MVSSETQTDSQITGWHDGNAAKLAHLGNSTARTPMLNTSVSRDIHEPKEQKISRGACGYNRGACTHRNTTTFFRPTTCKVRYTLPSNIFEDCNRLSGTAVSFDDLGDTIKPHPLFLLRTGPSWPKRLPYLGCVVPRQQLHAYDPLSSVAHPLSFPAFSYPPGGKRPHHEHNSNTTPRGWSSHNT